MIIRENVPLAPYTTLGVGGPARFFAEAASEGEVRAALDWAAARGLAAFILGGGSNLVVADEGFAGLVVRVAIKGVTARDGGNEGGAEVIVTAGAGEDWDELVAACVGRGLAGFECLSGIPGLVGGTPVQNVGAYGQEVSETVVGVRAYDRAGGRVVELGREECGFGYRASIFNTSARDRYVVLEVSYALVAGGRPALRYADLERYFGGRAGEPSLAEVRAAVREIRARKSMLLVPGDPDCRSAGSFFKNPVVAPEQAARIDGAAGERVPRYEAPGGMVKVPAAWLIERAGFARGEGRGRVAISTRHTLALVNRGGATARELLAFAGEIQERVRERFGVRLEPEPVLLGVARG